MREFDGYLKEDIDELERLKKRFQMIENLVWS